MGVEPREIKLELGPKLLTHDCGPRSKHFRRRDPCDPLEDNYEEFTSLIFIDEKTEAKVSCLI